ncbi:LysR family transcriptional regulator [Enterococcus sp. LJL128]
MNLRKYLIFQEVAKTENFTKAAGNLFITQSAVSHAVKELEEQAGTQLFERLHKSVRLTSAGELLLSEVLPVLEEYKKLERRVQTIEKEAPIQIASCITIAQIWLPAIIQDFQRKYPKTPVKVMVNSAEKSLALLKQGKADIAFLEGDVLERNILTKKFASYDIWAVRAPDGQKVRSMTIKQLLEEKLLLRERGSAVREILESTVTLAGYQVVPQWTSVDSQTLIEAAKAGLGISILPKVLVESELAAGRLEQIKLSDVHLTNDLTVALNKNKYRNQALQYLWTIASQSEKHKSLL